MTTFLSKFSKYRAFVVAFVVAFAIGVPLSGPAQARDNYGAIAYSPSTGGIGWAYDFSSRRAAENAALNKCYNYGGGCRVATWFRNACGALAIGNRGWGADWGPHRNQAEAKALNRCSQYSGNCWIERWVCTTR